MRSLTGNAGNESGLAEVSASARGWHGVQLAVLGFIGLCGVLQGADHAGKPRWLQVTAAVLVLVALVLGCLSVLLVATIAWPLGEQPPGDDERVDRARCRLRNGVALTFVAVAVLALGTTSSWWPRHEGQAGRVQVVTSNGVWCGQLRAGEPGLLTLDVGGRLVQLALPDVSRVQLVSSCG